MANMFMKLGSNKIKGAATAKFTGGDNPSKENWFAIRSMSWRATRGVTMNIGDGKNRDKGGMALSELTITKEMCGASGVILSRLYVPGEKGDVVDIIITKPSRAGKGVEVYFQLQLQHGRVVDYNLNAADGTTPFESCSVAYSKIMFKHWTEDEGGKLEPEGDVTYDVTTGTAESHAITGGGGGSDEL